MTPAGLADAGRLLSAWEDAAEVPPLARTAVLAAHAGLADHPGAILDSSVAVSAALAARLYGEVFGAVVDALASCPACGEMVEIPVPVGEFASWDAAGSAVVDGGAAGPLVVRAPSQRDLAEVVTQARPVIALMARCVRGQDGGEVDVEALPDAVRAGIEDAADTLAGAAAMTVRVQCPACAAPVRAPVDVTALLWEAVSAAAPAVLGEVAELAAAFGWSEVEVLAMRPARRRAYLALARGESA